MVGSSTEQKPAVKRLPVRIVLLFTLALVVVGGLRFARIDLAGTSFFAVDEYFTWPPEEGRHVDHLNIDIVQYLSMIENYRGVENAFDIQEPYPDFARISEEIDRPVKGPVDPFTKRVGFPWLASLLPMDATYAFATVNLVFLIIGLWCMIDALAVAGRSPTAQFFGAAMYVFALPLLVFGTSLFIDGATVGLFVVGYWLLVRRLWWALVVFLPVSYLFKEAILVLALPTIWAWRTTGHRFREPRFIAGTAVAVVGTVAVAAWASAQAPEAVFSFTVMPTLDYIQFNLTSPVSMVFFAVGVSTVVLPAILSIRHLMEGSSLRTLLDGEHGPDLVGFGAVAAMNLYSVVSTDLTLRTGWLIWPFGIGLAAVWIDANREQFDRLTLGLVPVG